MKKIILSLISCILLLSVLVSCAEKPENEETTAQEETTKATETTEAETTEPETTEPETTEPETNKPYKSVSAFVKSPEMVQQIKQTNDTIKQNGLRFDMAADGDKLIYKYYYLVDVDEKNIGKQLESALKGQESVFIMVADMMKDQICAKNPSVVVEYYSKNAVKLCSMEFFPGK